MLVDSKFIAVLAALRNDLLIYGSDYPSNSDASALYHHISSIMSGPTSRKLFAM